MLKNVMSFLVMKTFKIKHYFVGNSKSLIFLMSCKLCGKPYVQFTTERFRFQCNNYKYREKLRGKYCMQKSPHELFLIERCKGLINEVEFLVFFTLCPSDLIRREEVWRTKIKALATNDLNVQE